MECSLPWEVVFVGTGPLEGVAEPSVTAELLRAWRTTEGKKKKKNAREKKQHGDIFYSHLWWSDTRCPRVSRWRGGKQWALDWWGTGSPPAPDQRPEHLHRSCCRRNPPVHTHTHTHTHTQRKRPHHLWTETAGVHQRLRCVFTCSMPVPSVSMAPSDATCSLCIVSLQLQQNKRN